jgi:hypothetical protein
MTIVQIAANAVVAKLLTEDREMKSVLNELLSYEVEGAEHMTAFKAGRWNGRSSFFTWSKGSFPAGFLHAVQSELSRRGHTVQIVRKPLPGPLGASLPVDWEERYDYQPDTVRRLLRHGAMIARVATGGGKCLGRDTPVLMLDGTIKAVQDVKVGDLLMGPDSKPRTVLSTTSGVSQLYRVVPTKGDPYVVNDAHILSLKTTSRGYRGRKRDGAKYPKGEIVNVNVEDFLTETKTFRHTHKGWRTGVDFPSAASLTVDPYFLGLLLGDGSIGGMVSLTTADPEMVVEAERQAAYWGIEVKGYKKDSSASVYHLTSGRTGGKANPLMTALREMGLGAGEKFIPLPYRTASRAERLELLAGIIDTDGYYDGKCMYVTLKSERLLDDTIFLARSLGFAAYKKAVKKRCHNNGKVGTYFATVISGDLEKIPVRLERRKAKPRQQKKDHLVTGLTIEAIGEGEYFGFEIDGDRLFMLGDFTVTHNTMIAKLAIDAIRRPTLFLTTRAVLMYQMKETLERAGYQVGVLGDGDWAPRKGVNVGMVQTLAARVNVPEDADVEMIRRAEICRKILQLFEFVIGEEAHEAGGNSYFEILRFCKNARYRLALTATPFMRSDSEANMRLMAAFGHVGIDVSEKLLIDRGILARPIFKIVRGLPKPPKLYKSTAWQAAYRIGIVENIERNRKIVQEAARAVAHGLPVMILVQHKAHGKILEDLFEIAGIEARFIFGEHDNDRRRRALDGLKDGSIKVLIGSTILDVGVDVPAVGMVVLAGGGKAEVALRQRIGRGLRAKKFGPNTAFIVDFDDEWNGHLRDHARQRHAIIADTPGFAEGILAPGADFDFSGFARARAA